MSNPYQLIVFDWEGTLGDMLGAAISALRTVAVAHQLGDVDEGLAREYLSYGLIPAVQKLFPDCSMQTQESIMNAAQSTMMQRASDVFLFPGALDLLYKLKQHGFDLAIATNKGAQSLKRILQHADMAWLFTATRAAGQTPAKPDPTMLIELMTVCGVNPSETLMVGDSASDIEMARQIQVDAIGVNFYNQSGLEEELLAMGANAVFNAYQDLEDYLGLTGV